MYATVGGGVFFSYVCFVFGCLGLFYVLCFFFVIVDGVLFIVPMGVFSSFVLRVFVFWFLFVFVVVSLFWWKRVFVC